MLVAIMNVKLKNNLGEILDMLVDEPPRTVHRLLERASNGHFPLLRWVDPYGDTHFSCLQMRGPIPELESLGSLDLDQDERRTLERIAEMCAVCAREAHTFVVFIGD